MGALFLSSGLMPIELKSKIRLLLPADGYFTQFNNNLIRLHKSLHIFFVGLIYTHKICALRQMLGL